MGDYPGLQEHCRQSECVQRSGDTQHHGVRELLVMLLEVSAKENVDDKPRGLSGAGQEGP